jgi:hypothetical protein
MKQFEYYWYEEGYYSTTSIAKNLKNLGNEGWELVSVIVSPNGSNELLFYFKRQIHT